MKKIFSSFSLNDIFDLNIGVDSIFTQQNPSFDEFVQHEKTLSAFWMKDFLMILKLMSEFEANIIRSN